MVTLAYSFLKVEEDEDVVRPASLAEERLPVPGEYLQSHLSSNVQQTSLSKVDQQSWVLVEQRSVQWIS